MPAHLIKMRNISVSILQRTERVSHTLAGRRARGDDKLKRVRDVRHIDKRQRKYPRIFRVRRREMTPQNQRQFVKLLNSYQLRALRDWQGFADALPSVESLSDAQLFVLQSVQQNPYLYPSSEETLHQYKHVLATFNDDFEPSSEALQQLVAYDHYLEGLLSMLVLCRSYDQTTPKAQYHNSKHQECTNDETAYHSL